MFKTHVQGVRLEHSSFGREEARLPLRLCFAMILPIVVRDEQEVYHGNYRATGPSSPPFALVLGVLWQHGDAGDYGKTPVK